MSSFIPQSAYTRYIKTQEYMAMSGQINFYSVAIEDVKRRMGNSCSYLSHLVTSKKTERDTTIKGEDGKEIKATELINAIYFLAHLDIKGETRVVRINTGKTANELVAENYKALLTQLTDYVTGKKDI